MGISEIFSYFFNEFELYLHYTNFCNNRESDEWIEDPYQCCMKKMSMSNEKKNSNWINLNINIVWILEVIFMNLIVVHLKLLYIIIYYLS